ncbi:unnamed protein product [Protopolystoma xenopodis]|uniref:Uncharacterized protein n=1 Tax=Protopolystoma xenopodis TaxID=117903 RepID=A0A448XRX4_9PLAT|nr:unnamed protein product [Protopolystoma xenopodis]
MIFSRNNVFSVQSDEAASRPNPVAATFEDWRLRPAGRRGLSAAERSQLGSAASSDWLRRSKTESVESRHRGSRADGRGEKEAAGALKKARRARQLVEAKASCCGISCFSTPECKAYYQPQCLHTPGPSPAARNRAETEQASAQDVCMEGRRAQFFTLSLSNQQPSFFAQNQRPMPNSSTQSTLNLALHSY